MTPLVHEVTMSRLPKKSGHSERGTMGGKVGCFSFGVERVRQNLAGKNNKVAVCV